MKATAMKIERMKKKPRMRVPSTAYSFEKMKPGESLFFKADRTAVGVAKYKRVGCAAYVWGKNNKRRFTVSWEKRKKGFRVTLIEILK